MVKKKFTQRQLLAFTANMQTSLIGLEACSGAHFLGQALRQQGHDVRLIAALFVKPDEWKTVEQQIDGLTDRLEQIAEIDAGCCRIRQIPGIGPIVATANVAAIGNSAAFRKGRDFAAWLGIVPRQYSTGGKANLLSISKRGNMYLRKVLIHGARAAAMRIKRDRFAIGGWMQNGVSKTCS